MISTVRTVDDCLCHTRSPTRVNITALMGAHCHMHGVGLHLKRPMTVGIPYIVCMHKGTAQRWVYRVWRCSDFAGWHGTFVAITTVVAMVIKVVVMGNAFVLRRWGFAMVTVGASTLLDRRGRDEQQ